MRVGCHTLLLSVGVLAMLPSSIQTTPAQGFSFFVFHISLTPKPSKLAPFWGFRFIFVRIRLQRKAPHPPFLMHQPLLKPRWTASSGLPLGLGEKVRTSLPWRPGDPYDETECQRKSRDHRGVSKRRNIFPLMHLLLMLPDISWLGSLRIVNTIYTKNRSRNTETSEHQKERYFF